MTLAKHEQIAEYCAQMQDTSLASDLLDIGSICILDCLNLPTDVIVYSFEVCDNDNITPYNGLGSTDYLLSKLNDQTFLSNLRTKFDTPGFLTLPTDYTYCLPIFHQQDLRAGIIIKANYSITLPQKPTGFLSNICQIIAGNLSRIRKEEQLSKSLQAADAAAQSKQAFLGNINHELRTPMNGIIGYAGLLQMSGPEEFPEAIEHILTCSHNLMALLNDILDYSKMESGQIQIEYVDFNLQDIVEDVVDLLSVRASSKGLELTSEFSKNLPTMVKADPGRIRQVLVAIIGNAIKFTHAGSIQIAISSTPGSNGGNNIHFEVSDTGIGIDDKNEKLIFSAFTQVDYTITREFDGAGLGLATSKKLVNLMGGEIGFWNNNNEGTTFWFDIPTLHSHVTFDYIHKENLNSLSKTKIIIVDPNNSNREWLGKLISSWRMSCQFVPTASTAIVQLRLAKDSGVPYDLALINDDLETQSGVELAIAIRKLPEFSKLRLLLMHPITVQHDTEKLHQFGFSGSILKPIRQSQLFDLIISVCQTRTTFENNSTQFALSQEMAKSINPHSRILIVEDNPANQMVLLAILKALSVHADAVSSGQEAIEVLKEIAYDLVLMDCRMPEMDGFETTRHIRQLETDHQLATTASHLPIIAITASVLSVTKDECTENGMDGFIPKPVPPKVLAQTLTQWLSPQKTSTSQENHILPEQKLQKLDNLLKNIKQSFRTNNFNNLKESVDIACTQLYEDSSISPKVIELLQQIANIISQNEIVALAPQIIELEEMINNTKKVFVLKEL